MTFGIKKDSQKLLVEPEAVSQVKKLRINGCLYGPSQIYGWRIIVLLINPWLITLRSEIYSDSVFNLIHWDAAHTVRCCTAYISSFPGLCWKGIYTITGLD